MPRVAAQGGWQTQARPNAAGDARGGDAREAWLAKLDEIDMATKTVRARSDKHDMLIQWASLVALFVRNESWP